MALQSLVNSRLGVELVLTLGRVMPERLGYWLTRWGGQWFSGRRKEPMVRAVRANQWVIGDERLSAEHLDRRVRATFVHAGRCIYDYYHLLNDPAAAQQKVVFSPGLERAYQDWLRTAMGSSWWDLT